MVHDQQAADSPEAKPEAPDARVAGAVTHWGYRFTANGTAYHQERLAAEAPAAELALYPDGNHGVTNRAYESRSRMADWLAARLNF